MLYVLIVSYCCGVAFEVPTVYTTLDKCEHSADQIAVQRRKHMGNVAYTYTCKPTKTAVKHAYNSNE